MAAPSNLHNRISLERALNEAQALDLRRQRQIANQVDVMNRLLAERGVEDAEAGAKALAAMAETLGDAQYKLQRIAELTTQAIQPDGMEDADAISSIVAVLDGVTE